MRHGAKRFLSLLLAILMCVSLLPASALAEEPISTEDPIEEPAPAEETAPTEEPEEPAEPVEVDISGDSGEPEAAPADEEEPEELRKPYSLGSEVKTFKANGTLDTQNTGGAIQLDATSVNSGSVAACQVQTAIGYRLVAVYFGPTSAPLSSDVTSRLFALMPSSAAQFTAFFIEEGGTMTCGNAAVRISAPPLGGSYNGTVSADVTKYFNKDGTGYSALDAYSASAVWKAEDGSNPSTFRIGESYYAEITLTYNDGWKFANNFAPTLTMPDGSVVSGFTMERLPRGVRFLSPLYTIPETEGWHNLYGDISTYNANGEYDESLVGGTVTLSTGCAQEGAAVSCTVTPNSGYHLAYVLYGRTHEEPRADVTDTLQATMLNGDSHFRAVFVADGGKVPISSAAVRISSPTLNQSYNGPVPATLTNYLSLPLVLAIPSTFHVENAHWQLEGDYSPSILLPGDRARAVFDLLPNEYFRFSTEEGPFVEITMPDDSIKTSYSDNFTVTRNADGSVHVVSPWYNIPGSGSTHHVLGRVVTYDGNGNPDTVNAGGTITVSTDLAQAGDTVSCQVTVNPGYHLLMVQFAINDDEPVADVTDSLQAVMWDRDMEFRAYIIKDGGSIGCQAAAVRLDYPDSSGYASLPAATVTKYFSMTTWAVEPTAYRVTNAAWRDDDGQCVGKFYSVRDYYATFTLTPNEGWHFEDNFSVELTMPDGSVLKSYIGDFTITRNPDGSVDVKTPLVSVPDTLEPSDGSMALDFTVEVFDADYHSVPDVIGGTASFSPTHPRTGDTVTVTAEPAPGYQLQYVYYDDGVTMGYDATPEMSYVIPANYGTLSVCFTPVGTSLPLPSATQKVELPLAGALNSGSGRVLNGEHQWYDVESVTWYGGAGSGCQGQEPTRFLPGASYYAEVVLTPHAHWHWKTDAHPLVLYHDPSDPDPNSVNWDLHPDFSGSTCSLDSQGRLHIVGQEIPLPASTLGSVDLGIQMFQEGGEYPEGCPVVFELPDDAFFTVSNAVWYNYANQESGGIGLAAGFFTADGRYFTEFDLIPNQGYEFTANTQVVLTNGEVELKRLNSDGSLHVVTSWYSLNPENAAQQRRVFVTNYVMNADGTVSPSGSGGYVLPNDGSPKVGDTLIFGVMPKNGYRLQWMTAARDSEQIGEDITDSLAFYVADEPGDVYVSAFFALAEEPVTCSQVDLNVQLPAPGGNYSGLAPATVTPDVVNASKYTVVRTRWYEIQEHGVGTPSSFVPGEQYCVEILLAPNPGWCFGDNPGAFLLFSDGTSMDSRFGEVTPYKQSDGNLVLTSNFITLPETAVDSVELSLDLPEQGSSFVSESRPWATFYTPHVGEMYTIWKNGADQATGEKDSMTASFQPGCVYYATIRLHADQGYYLTEDTRVTLRNGLSFTTQYSTTDRSLWIHTESITIPTDSYQLSGTYVTFRLNDVEVTSARPGDYVVVRSDITTQPLGTYLASVTSEDVELTQITEITWGFSMPAKNVSVTGELLPQETYVFELEDGVHEMSAKDALWLFGEYETGTMITRDLDGDDQDDIRVEFRADGTAQVIRLGDIFGEITIQTPSGRIGTMIYRFGPERYDVYLGSVQVNAENKNNIPVLGGKASYDPDTKTLTLTDYTGSIGVAAQGELYPSLTSLFSITASGDLTVEGNGRLLDETLRGGIHCGGNLTLSGDFEIHAWLHGIYAEGNLTVYGSLKVYDTSQVGVGAGGDLRVTLGSLTVMADEGIGVDSRGNVTVAGELHSEAGEAGLQCGGNVTLVGGTIWVSSTNDIGLLGSSDLNIQNGGFTAYGNVQALEVASISFDNTTHFISLPVNGSVSADDTTIIDPSTGEPSLNAQITERKPTVSLSVKDLEGSEGVGGTVAINSGAYSTTASGSFNYGTQITIRAQAAEGYRFDHWEDVFGDYFTDESQSLAIQVGVYVDAGYVAVFEELLPITEPYFPDANFRSYISENFDLNSDGYLSWAERNAVTRIDVANKSITSLVGLKHFPELVSLYCYGNPNLQEVDVRVNPKIKYLRCYNNSRLARLYTAGCTELEVLWANNCALTNLQLNSCTKLTSLSCQNNNLYSLNLGHCPDLEILYCYGNANLHDLSVNSDALRLLHCYSTNLDTLDISSCSLMQEVFYRGTYTQTSSYDEYTQTESGVTSTLRCNPGAAVENDLGIPINKPNFPDDDFRQYGASSFDLNKNGWLSPAEIAQADSLCIEEWADMHNVQGIHFLTELTFIMIDGNPNLTELDVSQNIKLTGLEIYDNSLTTLILGQQPALESIYADHNAFTTVDLSGAPNLKYLDIANNPLTEIDLSAMPDLKELYIYGTELAELDLSGCPILLDAYLNGTRTENEDLGYVVYSGGPLGGRLLIDPDQEVVTEATPDHVPGDINGDGKVNNKDVTRLQRYLKGAAVEVNEAALDVNGDGKVNNKDLTRLQRYVKGADVELH